MFNRRIKPSGIRKSAGDVAGRVVASGPVACPTAPTRVKSPAVRDRITTRTIPIVWVRRNPKTDTDLFYKLVWVHGEAQRFRRDCREESTGAPQRLRIEVCGFGGVGSGPLGRELAFI